MKCLVGLGNPGSKYHQTRHNAGFIVLDELCRRFNIEWRGEKFQSIWARGSILGIDCLILKPQTFMNLSGRAVRQAMAFYKLKSVDVVVLHDDIDVPGGKVKAKVGGGHGGHNGIRSLHDDAGIRDFHRIKLGVGRPSQHHDVHSWVLGGFEPAQLQDLQEAMSDQVLDRLVAILKQ